MRGNTKIDLRHMRHRSILLLLGAMLALGGCTVGPHYQRPSAPVPAAYKEPPPASFKEAGEWKQAQPSDSMIRGKWWEIYNDPQLNALEEQVSISNQNVQAAEAQFRAAHAGVGIARSNLFPSISVNPSIVASRAANTFGNNQVGQTFATTRAVYSLPVDLSWTIDVWGSIRRSITASAEAAQVSEADLENARLSFQAELAQDYFQLHGTDGDQQLLDRTVASYQDYLQLTQNRFKAGVASGGDVAQAETQLASAQAELVDLGVQRAQLEHAIAILTGKAPADLSIPSKALASTPPPVPVGVPSTLLERRPDIAAAERQMAQANEQIGIAQAAYYPNLTLSAAAGLTSANFTRWLSWPSRFFSVGPQLSQTVFDAGRRRGAVAQTSALYEATVAAYRQTVLTGFQQVEDNLAALRVLEDEAAVQAREVDAAERNLAISTAQYKAGTASYLQVIIAQAAALSARRGSVDTLTRRMVSSVLLIEALGGGWDTSKLPTTTRLISSK
jgi:NodT family efflux transporter outer membrane factor (OMF) lipoprotein